MTCPCLICGKEITRVYMGVRSHLRKHQKIDRISAQEAERVAKCMLNATSTQEVTHE